MPTEEAAQTPAPEAAAPAADVSAPAVDAAPEAPAADVTPEVTADSFTWDAWTGSAEDLPETVRPWASKMSEFYARSAQSEKEEAARLRKVYEAMMEGREDPRLTELQQKLEESKKTWDTEKQTYEQVRSEYETYKKAVEEWQDQQVAASLDDFKQKNAWIFESDELSKLGSTLMDEGFDPFVDLPVALRLPDAVLDRARSLMKELKGAKNAGQHAIRLARAEVRLPASNPAAELVNGTEARISGKTHETTDPTGTASLDELARMSVRRHLRSV